MVVSSEIRVSFSLILTVVEHFLLSFRQIGKSQETPHENENQDIYFRLHIGMEKRDFFR